MKRLHQVEAARSVLAARFLGRRQPLLVGWALTSRCRFRCAYCHAWREHTEELDTASVCALVDEMATLGTRRIQFTGGEPLLRADLGAILTHCARRDISTAINTCGTDVRERIRDLAPVSLIGTSLDGDERTQDRIRGDGAYRAALDALAVARDLGVRARITTVLSRDNLDQVDEVLAVAARYHAVVLFQPATANVLRSDEPNPLAPQPGALARVVTDLIARRRRGERWIGNSVSGLRYLRRWPEPHPLPCVAGRLVCRIDADGTLRACPRVPPAEHLDCRELGFREAFARLAPTGCAECWTGSRLETNLIARLDPRACLNGLRLL